MCSDQLSGLTNTVPLAAAGLEGGRSLLFPPDDGVAAVVDAAVSPL
jgi:hypothetical protein